MTWRERVALGIIYRACLEAWNNRPVRELTPEEYEAKVAAGKKVTFAKGGVN